MSHQLRHLGSVTLKTAWSLARAMGVSHWLLRLLVGFSRAPPGPAARDWGRWQWWPEPVVCIHLADCIHTHSGESWDQEESEPIAGARAASGALVVGM